MFANFFLNVADAHEIEKGGNGTTRENYIHEGCDMFGFMLLTLFTMLLGIRRILVWLDVKCFDKLTIS